MTEDTDVEFTRERRDLIVRLLETLTDGLPEPSRRDSSTSGFTPAKELSQNRMSCPDCLANDRAIYGCETCGGSGWVLVPLVRDPYMESATVGFDPTKHDAAYARDRQIEALARQTRPAPSEAELLEEANRRGFLWEEARRAMYRSFDYGAVDRALESLRIVDELAYRMLHQVYVYGWLTHITPAVESVCDRGLRFLSDRLPERLRAPGSSRPVANVAAHGRSADPRALAQRDDAIRRAIDAGEATAAVAAAFGVSPSQVNRIVAKAA